MSNLIQVGPAQYEIPKQGGMRVPGLVIASEELLREVEMSRALEQVVNVAYLPGIVGYSIAMPDIHWGYGFPIGGVAATDAKEGVISPGGVGYDINCGVRLALAPLPFASLSGQTKRALLEHLFRNIPSGVGHGQRDKTGLSEQDYLAIARMGSRWTIERGDGFAEDLEHTESLGCLAGADCSAVSSTAKQRGSKQLGSIGSGNHFVEIGAIDQLFNPKIAAEWGVQEGQTYILIHSGSRGFGHQICQDTLDLLIQKGFGKDLPDRQLVCAPIQSPEGQQYFRAMATAANFAFNNRQRILARVRDAFKDICHVRPEEIRLLYDVCHNIAKFETHEVNGKKRELCVHRKGATRAFGPGAEDLAPTFKKTGQPVLVPGDMGRASYLLVGQGNTRTFCSACHGAGRAKSRVQAMKEWKQTDLRAVMKERGVDVIASSMRTVAEEMPNAYKDVELVVQATQEAGLAGIVARLKPHLVIKG